MRLPESLSNLFKNYAFSTIDDRQHASLIIKTVLSRGTWEQITWLLDHYGKDNVGEVFREDYFGLRTMPEPTRRLWELLFVDESSWDRPGDISSWRCRRLVPLSENPEAEG